MNRVVMRSVVGLTVGLAVLGAAAPSFALTVSRSGASTVSTSGSTIYVSDTAADGNSAVGNYYYSGSGSKHRLEDQSGNGTAVSRTESGTITSIQACVAYQFSPDSCSGWVS